VVSELGPDFDAQAAEVCGLYLDPPENAIVVSIDEKTGVQAKGLVRPDGTPAPAKPARRDNEYVRNGTQNLFAALQVHSGEVSGMASKTRNRFDFIAFLDRLEDEIPARQVGRGDPRQPLDQARLVAQPGRDLLLDPAAPADQARHLRLRGRPRDPDAAFVEHYNLTARPFEWTHTGKVLVV